jgi:threonine dehydratase
MFQRTGSFKFRGASNAVRIRTQGITEARKREMYLVTVSSGNFAQGAALAAKVNGLKARIVMPRNTTKLKVDAVRSYGAEVEFCDPDQRDEHCAEVVRALGSQALFIHPSEDPGVIAGNGTLAVEMLEQVRVQYGKDLDVIVVPVGGGGVISGVAAVARARNVLVIGAEPLNADDAFRSKQQRSIQGHRIAGKTPNTVAEGLRTTLGPNTFPVVRDWVHAIIRVAEEEIVDAMRLVLERLKCVAEPSSCVAYAAVRSNDFRQIIEDRFGKHRPVNIGLVLTGGNVDFSSFAQGMLSKV